MGPESRARILIVDDDRPIRDLLATVLDDAVYETSQAFNGRHAIDLLPQAAPDLIICDIMMPIMGGVDLCRYVKERGNVAVILMSSAAAGAEGAGHDAFLSKPFDLDSLESLVASVLQDRALSPGA